MPAPETLSPFASAFPALSSLGYACIPIMARAKAPGDYRGSAWKPAFGWQKYRDRLPTAFETGLWSRNWPDANIGVILGTRQGDRQLVAVDFDVTDPDILDELARTIPVSPMRKRGSKGFTAFYLAPLEVRSQKIKAGEAGAIDILTGNETRQTVMPPSVHPSGEVYRWIAGPVAVADLPALSLEDLERLADTAACWLPAAAAPLKTVVPLQPVDGPFAELNQAALANLSAWVPDLDGLHNLQQKAAGYMAVAAFRPSSSGRPLSQRKQNLSITVHGIKDFGTDTGYSPLDLVMAAQGMGFDAAFGWLQDRVFPPADLPAVHVAPPPSASMKDAEILRAVPTLTAPSLRVPGLVGDLTDWIVSTSLKPQPQVSLLVALTVIGTVIGRRVATPFRKGGTHLYAIGLVATGGGKDHPLTCCSVILKAAGYSHLIGPGEFISMPAVVKRLMRTPLMLCPMDEIGSFLHRILSKKASGFEREISGQLRKAWSANFTPIQTPEWANMAAETINAPAMSIFGVSTVEEFWSGLSGADIKNGLLNRFLIVENKVRPEEDDQDIDRLAPPPALLQRIQALNGRFGAVQASIADPVPEPLGWGAGAAAAFKALQKEVQSIGDAKPEKYDYLQRTAEMALRIATIIAAGRLSPNVDVADLEIGRNLALSSAEAMFAGAQEHMSETEHQAQSRLVFGIIKKEGRISRTTLYRKIDGRLDGRTLDNILASLTAGGQIGEGVEKSENPSGGRPTKVYFVDP